MHQRMTENVEISNPMYLREDLDDDGDNFTLDSIAKVSCIFFKIKENIEFGYVIIL